MARVNHKLVMQRLNECRSKITDRQFFTSRILAGHFEDMALAQTRRYHYNRRVRVIIEWLPKSAETASTDNRLIRINAGNKLVTGTKGRPKRYQIVNGLFAHELGHILYTDFLAMQTYTNSFEAYRWFPSAPVYTQATDRVNEADFWDYVKADRKNLVLVQRIAHNIHNALEDGYIENRMLVNFPGTLGYGLTALRELHFTSIPTVTELKEKEADGERHIFESIMQNILSYVKFGEIKYGEEPLTDERIQVVFGLINELDQAVMTRSAKERLGIVNLILIRCWPYIKDLCEQIKTQADMAGTLDPEGAVAEIIVKKLSSIKGASLKGSGDSTPVREDGEADPKGTPRLIAIARSKTKADAESAKSEKEESKPEGATEAGEGKKDDESKAEKPTEPETETEISSVEPESEGEAEGDDDSDGELGEAGSPRIPYHITESVSDPVGGTTEHNPDYKASAYEDSARQIESLLDQMAERAACKELEGERIQELNEAAKKISYGNVHAGVDIRVNRMDEVDDGLIERYNQIAPELLMISRQLQRTLIHQLEDSRRGGKQTGLLFGRRLNARTLHRNDGKVFYKNNLPQEMPQLAVGLLLDESGSMGGSMRSTYARAAAIILYDFCHSLGIPIMVYGHSTESFSKQAVSLYSYAEFDDIDGKDKYRLMDIKARCNNRDGAALRFVAEQLSKRQEDVRLLILVSDGQPMDYGYSGSAAEEDLRGIQREYQKKGLVFVAAAIGDDKRNIERIYGDSFMDITDLRQLPVKLTSVVKRHIRV